MDMATMSMAMNLSSLQSAASTGILDRAMNRDAQSMALLLGDIAAANPAPAVLAPRMGGMDISI